LWNITHRKIVVVLEHNFSTRQRMIHNNSGRDLIFLFWNWELWTKHQLKIMDKERSSSYDSHSLPQGSGQPDWSTKDDLKLRGELIIGLSSLYTKRVMEGWKIDASNKIKSVFPSLPVPSYPPPQHGSGAGVGASGGLENQQRRSRAFSTGNIFYPSVPFPPTSSSSSTSTPSSPTSQQPK
jgi:hypothetical protein